MGQSDIRGKRHLQITFHFFSEKVLTTPNDLDSLDYLFKDVIGPYINSLNNLGDYDTALREIDRSLEVLKAAWEYLEDNAQIYFRYSLLMYYKGRTLKERGDFLKALNFFETASEYLNKAVSMDPEDAGGYSNLAFSEVEQAEILKKTGQSDLAQAKLQKAIELTEQAIKYDPNKALYHRNLGYSLMFKGELLQEAGLNQAAMELYAHANNAYSKALEIDPRFYMALEDRANTLSNRAEILLGWNLHDQALREIDLALSDYNQAIDLAPSSSRLYGNGAGLYFIKGTAYRHANQQQNALQVFKKMLDTADQAIAINPLSADAHNKRGLAFLNQGLVLLDMGTPSNALSEFEKAISCFDKALGIAPQITWANINRSNAFFNRARILMDAGDIKKAFSEFEKALAADEEELSIRPNSVAAHRNRRDALLWMGYHQLEENQPAAPFYLAEGLAAALEWAKLRPAPFNLREAAGDFRRMAAVLPEIRAFSETIADEIVETGQKIVSLRAKLDPEVNSAALINKAEHFRSLGSPWKAVSLTHNALAAPDLGPAAACTMIATLIEDLNLPNEALQAAAAFLYNSPLQINSMDDYLALVFLCAPQVKAHEDLASLYPGVLRLLKYIPPNKQYESAFLDLCETFGAMLRSITENSCTEPEKLSDLYLDALQHMSRLAGVWAQAGVMIDPEDDPSEMIKNITAHEAAKILSENYRRGADMALSVIEDVVNTVIHAFREFSGFPFEQRLAKTFEVFRQHFDWQRDQSEEDAVERAMRIMEVLFCELAPQAESLELSRQDFGTGLEHVTAFQLATARMLLRRCAGTDFNFGLVIIPLAIALEEEFRAKLLNGLLEARKKGALELPDLSDGGCRRAESKFPDNTCERYRKYLEERGERLLFGDLIQTWDAVTGKRKKTPPFFTAVVSHFRGRISGSPLMEKAAASCIQEIGEYRNRATHPGKAPVDLSAAQKIYTICTEAMTVNHPKGLIPEMASVARMNISA